MNIHEVWIFLCCFNLVFHRGDYTLVSPVYGGGRGFIGEDTFPSPTVSGRTVLRFKSHDSHMIHDDVIITTVLSGACVMYRDLWGTQVGGLKLIKTHVHELVHSH